MGNGGLGRINDLIDHSFSRDDCIWNGVRPGFVGLEVMSRRCFLSYLNSFL